MSFTQNDKVLPAKITNKMVANSVARVLRLEHVNSDAAIKRIERMTGANPNSICKWYQGRNAPKSAHLLLLAKHYPSILHMMLEMIGQADIWEIHKRNIDCRDIDPDRIRTPSTHYIYSAKSCTINFMFNANFAAKLSRRQYWFMESLQQGLNIKAADIVSIWKVSLRTAKYDVAELVDSGLIQFVGARKTGRYYCI